jgi:hypothetical protein
MVSAGNKSQRRSGDSIYRLPNDRAVTTTSRSILASRFSATEEVLMTHNPWLLSKYRLLEKLTREKSAEKRSRYDALQTTFSARLELDIFYPRNFS